MVKLVNISKAEAYESVKRCANTEDGKILLAVLQRECGFMHNFMSIDDPNKTQVMAAQRGVYAKLRKYIKPENLIDIEYRINIVENQEEKKK